MKIPLIPPLAQTEDEVVRGPLPKNLAVTTYGETSYGGIRPAAKRRWTSVAGEGRGITSFNNDLLSVYTASLIQVGEDPFPELEFPDPTGDADHMRLAAISPNGRLMALVGQLSGRLTDMWAFILLDGVSVGYISMSLTSTARTYFQVTGLTGTDETNWALAVTLDSAPGVYGLRKYSSGYGPADTSSTGDAGVVMAHPSDPTINFVAGTRPGTYGIYPATHAIPFYQEIQYAGTVLAFEIPIIDFPDEADRYLRAMDPTGIHLAGDGIYTASGEPFGWYYNITTDLYTLFSIPDTTAIRTRSISADGLTIFGDCICNGAPHLFFWSAGTTTLYEVIIADLPGDFVSITTAFTIDGVPLVLGSVEVANCTTAAPWLGETVSLLFITPLGEPTVLLGDTPWAKLHGMSSDGQYLALERRDSPTGPSRAVVGLRETVTYTANLSGDFFDFTQSTL